MTAWHRVRRLALQGLCCLDVQGQKAIESLDAFIADSGESEPIVVAARRVMRQVFQDRQRCDQLLAKHAHRWELSRLALVDRNILRLSVHEMLESAASPARIIAEALRLAEEFSTADSPRFVNGILDAVSREIRPRPAPAGAQGPKAGQPAPSQPAPPEPNAGGPTNQPDIPNER